MVKHRRRYSIKHSNNKINNNKPRTRTRTRTKRGGEGTPPYETHISPYVSFYNPKTGKQNIENAKFYNPKDVSKKSQIQTDILHTNGISAEEVFSKPPGYYSKESVAERKRIAAEEEYAKLIAKYKEDTNQPVSNKISDKECTDKNCNISGGRTSRKHKRRSKKQSKIMFPRLKRVFNF
jgi:hypothetical protein